MMEDNSPETEKLISSFIKITSSSREVAISFLETHQWNLNVAVSSFSNNEVAVATAEPNVPNPSDEQPHRRNPFPNLRIDIPSPSDDFFDYSPSLRAPLPSWPSFGQFYLESNRAAKNPFGRKQRQGEGNISTFADFSGGTDNEFDETLESYDGEDDRDIERPEQSSRSMSAETVSDELQEEPKAVFIYTVTSWRNGFTINDGPLRTLDNPENATLLQAISRLESPRELGDFSFQVELIRREEEYFTQGSQAPFHGVGRTLSESDSASTEPPALAVSPSMSGRLVKGSQKAKDVDAIFNRATEAADVELPRSIVTIWKNGFTVNAGPLQSLEDPEDAAFLEMITRLESPRVLYPVRVQIELIRREEEIFGESPSFQGVGRTLAVADSLCTEPQDLPASLISSMGSLAVDHAAPTTSIQLRLGDGTRIVTQFNTHHTVRDVRGFIDASRPDETRDYQLLIMGFPPTPLSDLNQTIEEAGIANSVLIQKF